MNRCNVVASLAIVILLCWQLGHFIPSKNRSDVSSSYLAARIISGYQESPPDLLLGAASDAPSLGQRSETPVADAVLMSNTMNGSERLITVAISNRVTSSTEVPTAMPTTRPRVLQQQTTFVSGTHQARPFPTAFPRKSQSTLQAATAVIQSQSSSEHQQREHHSSVRCFQSKHCGKDCIEPLNWKTECVRSASKCDSRLMTRTCVYENLYFQRKDKRWIFFSKPATDSSGSGYTESASLCTSMLRDYFPWAPTIVRTRKPPVVAASATVNRTIHVEQKYHSSFGHSLSEQLFGLYWQAAEVQGTWDINPAAFQLYYDGHLMETNLMWTENEEATGRPKNWLRDILPLLFDGGYALHKTHRDMTRYPVTLARRLVVGGYGGRSPYNAATYQPFVGLFQRPTQKYDDEYSHEEKAVAFMHYSEYLLQRALVSKGTSRFSTRRIERMYVVMLARPRSERRYMMNYQQLFRALKKRFGERLYPRVVNTGSLPLRDLMLLLQNTSLLISPHGSHNSNIGWMPVGSALMEIHPTGCPFVKGYDTIADLLSMHYGEYSIAGGCSPHLQFRTNIDEVVKRSALLHKQVLEQYDQVISRASKRWRRGPRREASADGGPGDLTFDPKCTNPNPSSADLISDSAAPRRQN